ncbi:MAG TPA: YdcF family protein [Planctomycetaceae bacterium]|nr:YdcF family protein [Planctomycetaceae bacterium]
MYSFFVRLSEPFVVLHLAVAAGLVALWLKRPRHRRRLILLTVAFVLLWAGSTDAVAYLALGSLEWAYPRGEADVASGEAIVVLSGSTFRPDKRRRKAELGDSSLRRCVYAARLYHRGRRRPVVATGGKVHAEDRGLATAELMKAFLVEMGVPQEDVITEGQSRNTYENAAKTARLLRERQISTIVLVTDAQHMRRAVLCFAAQGFQVIPAGCYYRATEFRWGLFRFLPDPDAAGDVEDAAHEWLGMLWYRLRGWI